MADKTILTETDALTDALGVDPKYYETPIPKTSLTDDIKNYAYIDVQILHRFMFLPEYIDRTGITVITVFDKYKRCWLENITFSDSDKAISYLRRAYKKEPGEEYDIIKKKVKKEE